MLSLQPPTNISSFLYLIGLQRRLPLEVLREQIEENDTVNRRFTIIGSARNSAVFTSARPVLSFSTEGAIGMYHATGDGNGASSSIFWPNWDIKLSSSDRAAQTVLNKMNKRFALFAFVIEGEIEVMRKLRSGDFIKTMDIVDGAWSLEKRGS